MTEDSLLTPSPALLSSAQNLGLALQSKGWTCATAESCTGGLVAALCTAVPGASAWFVGGVVAYANAVKIHTLGVDSGVLESHGAVSDPVVLQMAAGAAAALHAEVAVSISGVAGPGGGSAEKPVGTVWVGYWVKGVGDAQKLHLHGSREDIRSQAVQAALGGLLARILA